MTTTVEAWSLPTAGPMVKKDFSVSFQRLQVELTNSEPTQGVIAVDRSTKDRIIDSANDETSLIRVFKDGHNCQSFIARSVQYPYGRTGPVQISGPTLHEELSNAVILPQNYPEPEDADFEYQSVNVLDNGDAEGGEATWVGDDFEDGITAGDAWSEVSGGDWNTPTSFGVNSTWARSGIYSMRMNPSGPQSAIRRTVACTPNTVVWIWSYVATPDAPDVGTILATGVTIEEGGGYLANSIYKQYYLEDGLLVAEVNNQPKGTGTTPDTDFHPIGMKFLTGPEQTSFDFYFIHFGLSTVQHANIDDIVVTNVGVGIEPWIAWAGVEFSRQTSVVYEGTYAFQFQVVDYTLSEFTKGILQIVPTGGNIDRLFTFTGRLRSNSATPRSIIAVIKKASGPWYPGSTAYSITNGGWTEFSVSAVITEEEFQVELRDGQSGLPGGSNGPIIYADAMEGYWGLGEATIGAILQEQLAIIQARGVLTWLKIDSFDDIADSNNIPWPQNEEIILWHGMTFLQVLDSFRNRGYEWDIVWNDSAEMYELLVFYPYTMGGDLTSTGLKFHALNLAQSTIIEADPGANNFYGEGADGIFSSVVNASLESAYGPREMWINDQESVTVDALDNRLLKASVDATTAKFSLVTVVDGWFTPGLTAGPGALVKVELSGEVAEREERIARMIFTVNGGKESTVMNFGSPYYGAFDPPNKWMLF